MLGITKEPFNREALSLLPQQKTIVEMIKSHAAQGGFSVITGMPGVGKSVICKHVEKMQDDRKITVVSCSRTMHTYLNILKQLAESFRLDAKDKQLEKALIQNAFDHIKARKTLYVLIDEAHLLEMQVLRKLRLLFDKFPRTNNLVLLGQPDLMYYLTLTVNQDIKGRITYSKNIVPLNDDDLENYIIKELEAVRLGINTFDTGAIDLITRSAQGNLRLCRNLCYSSLLEACKETRKIVTISDVNSVLIQPHWRSHEELLKQQVS